MTRAQWIHRLPKGDRRLLPWQEMSWEEIHYWFIVYVGLFYPPVNLDA